MTGRTYMGQTYFGGLPVTSSPTPPTPQPDTWYRAATRLFTAQMHDTTIKSSEQSAGSNRWSSFQNTGWTVYSGQIYKKTYATQTGFVGWEQAPVGGLVLGPDPGSLTSGQYVQLSGVLYVHLGGLVPGSSGNRIWVDGNTSWIDMLTLGSSWVFLEPSFIADDNTGFTAANLDNMQMSLLDARQRGKKLAWRFYMNGNFAPSWIYSSNTTTQGEVIPKCDSITLADSGEDQYSYSSVMWNRGGARRNWQRFYARLAAFYDTVIPTANGGNGTDKWGDYCAYVLSGVGSTRQGAEAHSVDGANGLTIASATLVAGTTIRVTFADYHGLIANQQIRITGGTGMTAINGTWHVTIVSTLAVDLQGSTGAGTYTANSATMYLGTSGASDTQYNVTQWRTYLNIPAGGPYTASADATLNTARQTDVKQSWINSLNDQVTYFPGKGLVFPGGAIFDSGGTTSIAVMAAINDPAWQVLPGVTNFQAKTGTVDSTDYVATDGTHYHTWANTQADTYAYFAAAAADGRNVWLQTSGYTSMINAEFLYSASYEALKWNAVVFETGTTTDGSNDQQFLQNVTQQIFRRQLAPISGPASSLAIVTITQTSTGASMTIHPSHSIGAGSTAIFIITGQGTAGSLTSVTDSNSNTWSVDESYSSANGQVIFVAHSRLAAQLNPTDSVVANFGGTVGASRVAYLFDWYGLNGVDKVATNTAASGATISAGPSAALSQAVELVLNIGVKKNSSATYGQDPNYNLLTENPLFS